MCTDSYIDFFVEPWPGVLHHSVHQALITIIHNIKKNNSKNINFLMIVFRKFQLIINTCLTVCVPDTCWCIYSVFIMFYYRHGSGSTYSRMKSIRTSLLDLRRSLKLNVGKKFCIYSRWNSQVSS